jgi:3,4-dihydroxy 2-butanone 4-phosphate synthase
MISTTISPLEQFGLTSQRRVEQALQHLQKGKGIILIDDEDRENEGDLVFSAHHINVHDMALMIRACSGIVCLCLTN